MGFLVQRNLSKPNLLGTKFCVQYRQVLLLYMLNYRLSKISHIENLCIVFWFVQDYDLFKVWFTQVCSLSILYALYKIYSFLWRSRVLLTQSFLNLLFMPIIKILMVLNNSLMWRTKNEQNHTALWLVNVFWGRGW